MQRQLRGIALILFGILFVQSAGGIINILYSLGIGVGFPVVLIGLIIGIVGLLTVFVQSRDSNYPGEL